MKSYPNIEKLPGRAHYTGYAGGTIWRIIKDGAYWFAFAQGVKLNVFIVKKTLAEVSKELDAVANDLAKD
jgi:predicted DNA-binding transcriptional regulator AlpA